MKKKRSVDPKNRTHLHVGQYVRISYSRAFRKEYPNLSSRYHDRGAMVREVDLPCGFICVEVADVRIVVEREFLVTA